MAPISQCFNNSHIVQRIISAKQNLMEHLQLRLVSKTFNQEYLHTIRKQHRKVFLDLDDVETVFNDDDDYVSEQFYLLVNKFRVKVELGEQYFRFLVNVAGVKVIELRTRHLNFIESPELRKLAHDYTMKVFLGKSNLKVLTGIGYICDGCENCERHTVGCREYGPLQYDLLVGVFQQQEKHFEKLIVWESLFCKIATSCVQNALSRDECLNRMRSFITPNISCDHLEIVLNEKPYYDLEEEYEDTPTQPVPREVLEEMCRVWRVKTIYIKLSRLIEERVLSAEWSSKEYFTEFRFDDPYEITRVSTGIRLDTVEIDLNYSRLAAQEFFNVNTDQGYDNLLANAMRVFPTDSVSVRSERFNHDFDFNLERFERILNAVWRDGSLNNTRITMKYSPDITVDWNFFDIPSEFPFQGRMFSCEFVGNFETEELKAIVSMFRITNKANKCQLDLEIHVRKAKLAVFIEKEQEQGETLEELNVGFLRYFM